MVLDNSLREWRRNWYYIGTNDTSPPSDHALCPGRASSPLQEVEPSGCSTCSSSSKVEGSLQHGLDGPHDHWGLHRERDCFVEVSEPSTMELNQVESSVLWRRFHMTKAHQATNMFFLQPKTPYLMKAGILPLFEDPSQRGPTYHARVQ